MTSAFSWQNSISLCPASFCTPRLNLPVIPDISWLLTFVFQSPMMKRTSFFLLLVLEGLVSLHRTVQLQLLWHQWLGHRPGLLWYWMICLGSYWDHSATDQTTGREHSPTHQQNIGLKICLAWPCPQNKSKTEQDPVSPQPVPPIRKLPQAS